VVICLERGADLHMAQLMSLPLTVSCFSKTQIGFTFLVPADPGSPGKGPLNGCMYVCMYVCNNLLNLNTPALSIPKHMKEDPEYNVKKVKVAHTRLSSVGFRS